MKKNKYPITPQVNKLIIEIAKGFPDLQKYDGSGKLIWQIKTITKTWERLSPEEVKEMGGEKLYHPKRPRESFRRPKLIIFKSKEPLLFNHEVEMRTLYQQKGKAGIDEYVDWVNAIVEKHNKKSSETKIETETESI